MMQSDLQIAPAFFRKPAAAVLPLSRAII